MKAKPQQGQYLEQVILSISLVVLIVVIITQICYV